MSSVEAMAGGLGLKWEATKAQGRPAMRQPRPRSA
jgi:hypothetical protein